MRSTVRELIELGQMPNSNSPISAIQAWEKQLMKIMPPLTNEEAISLIELFPSEEDHCFGLAWTLIHLIESAEDWPIQKTLTNINNPWVTILKNRLK